MKLLNKVWDNGFYVATIILIIWGGWVFYSPDSDEPEKEVVVKEVVKVVKSEPEKVLIEVNADAKYAHLWYLDVNDERCFTSIVLDPGGIDSDFMDKTFGEESFLLGFVQIDKNAYYNIKRSNGKSGWFVVCENKKTGTLYNGNMNITSKFISTDDIYEHFGSDELLIRSIRRNY